MISGGDFMRKMKLIFSIFVILTLTGCIDTGCCSYEVKSIEYCVEKGICHYESGSVRTEVSDMANRLSELIINKEDDFDFFYSKYPDEDRLSLRYTTSIDLMDSNAVGILSALFESINIAGEFYDIDKIEAVLNVEKSHLTISRNDKDILSITGLIRNGTYESDVDIPEDEMIERFEINSSLVLFYLNNFKESCNGTLGAYGNNIVVGITTDGLSIGLNSFSDTVNVRAKIEELFAGYEYTVIVREITEE